MLIPHGTEATPVLHDAAYVTAQVNAALGNASEDILGESHAQNTSPEGVMVPAGQVGMYKAFVSMKTGDRHYTFSIGSQVIFESGESTPGQFVAIDYRSRTYTPDQIKAAMSSGRLAITARNQQIDGQDTIKLTGRLAPSMDQSAHPYPITQRFWVNSTTYLPVRWEIRDDNGTWAKPTDYTWQAPTPENDALLTVKIPAGFTKTN